MFEDSCGLPVAMATPWLTGARAQGMSRGEYNLQQLWSLYAVVKKQNILIWLKKGSKVHAREQLYVWRRRAATEK
jgi:hypothetical protein